SALLPGRHLALQCGRVFSPHCKGSASTAMTDRIADYLAWARHMDGVLHDRPELANLFASATREPRALLEDALRRAGQDGLLARLNTPMTWGHPALLQSLRRHYHVPESE